MGTAWSLQYLRINITNEDHQSCDEHRNCCIQETFPHEIWSEMPSIRKEISRASSPPAHWSCLNTLSPSFTHSTQTDQLYCCLLLHQPTELMVHQGGREKLFKNAVGTENLGHVSLESWASGKTSRWRQKGLVGGRFPSPPPPVNYNLLFADVKRMNLCACLHMCRKKKIQCCLHMWTSITKIHSVSVIGKFYLLRNGHTQNAGLPIWGEALKIATQPVFPCFVFFHPLPPTTNIKKYANEESAFSVPMLYTLRFTLSVPQHLAVVLPNLGQLLISVGTSHYVSLTLVTFWLTWV